MANFRLATRTLQEIDHMLELDGGARYRGWLQKVLPTMGDAYRTEEESFRSHMGASLMGDECARKIYYGWRWTLKPSFPGRILRLFNRGHLEEARFISLLLMIGCDVRQQDGNGKQFRISFGDGHGGGSGDGVAKGLPDLDPNTWCLLEFKTHNDASFKKLVKEGVRSAKFEHYVQMQLYMLRMGLPIAMYGAVNKNDDSLHLELVELNTEVAEQFLNRGEQLVRMRTPPKRMSESPGFYKCKWCDMHSVCHGSKRPAVNCRTCVFAEAAFTGDGQGRWKCNQHKCEITNEIQQKGCSLYQQDKDL